MSLVTRNDFLNMWFRNIIELGHDPIDFKSKDDYDTCLDCMESIVSADKIPSLGNGESYCSCPWPAPYSIASAVAQLEVDQRADIIYEKACELCINAYDEVCPFLNDKIKEISVIIKDASIEDYLEDNSSISLLKDMLEEPLEQCEQYEEEYDDEADLLFDNTIVLDMDDPPSTPMSVTVRTSHP